MSTNLELNHHRLVRLGIQSPDAIDSRHSEINLRKISGIQQIQDILDTSLTIKPFDPGRETEDKLHKQHCQEASAEFQLILTLSAKTSLASENSAFI